MTNTITMNPLTQGLEPNWTTPKGPAMAFVSNPRPVNRTTIPMQNTPAWINWVMFLGVIVWEIFGGILLWAALFGFNGSGYAMVDAAFVVNIALWGAFIVMDELFQAWAAEIGNSNAMEAHRSLLVAWLISLMAIHLL